jgi:hypothetical protein
MHSSVLTYGKGYELSVKFGKAGLRHAPRSCTTNLFSNLNEWTCLLDEREPVDAVYLDFAMAFDNVPHERLLPKMMSLRIESNLPKWIRDFLVGSRQRVSINGTLTDWT